MKLLLLDVYLCLCLYVWSLFENFLRKWNEVKLSKKIVRIFDSEIDQFLINRFRFNYIYVLIECVLIIIIILILILILLFFSC